MGEPARQEPKTPGIPGFAASFASSSRQPGDRDTPSALSRVLTVGLVVVFLGAGVFGIGKLIDYQRDHDKARHDQASTEVAATKTPLPGASRTSSGNRGQQDKPPSSVYSGPAGPARYAPPSYTPHTGVTSPPSTPASTGSGGKGASSGATQGAQQQSSASQQSANSAAVSSDNSGSSGSSGYRIVGVASNKCIDVTDHTNSAPDKTVLQIYSCGNNPNQQWTFYKDGTVRSLGMCMSVLEGSTANGASIDVYTCNGSASQKWKFSTAGDLVNVKADRCVDVRDLSTANSARLQLWDCAGSSNQKWRLA